MAEQGMAAYSPVHVVDTDGLVPGGQATNYGGYGQSPAYVSIFTIHLLLC